MDTMRIATFFLGIFTYFFKVPTTFQYKLKICHLYYRTCLYRSYTCVYVDTIATNHKKLTSIVYPPIVRLSHKKSRNSQSYFEEVKIGNVKDSNILLYRTQSQLNYAYIFHSSSNLLLQSGKVFPYSKGASNFVIGFIGM